MSTTTSSVTTPPGPDHLVLLNGQTVSANSFANLPVPPPPPPPTHQSGTINRINLNMNPLNENFYHTLTQLKDNGDHADYNNPAINMRQLIIKQQQQQQQHQLLMNTLKNFNMHCCDNRTKSPSCVKRSASKKSKKAKSESKESAIGHQQQQLQQQANYYLLPNCLAAQPMLYNDMELIGAAFVNQNLANANLVFNREPKQMCSFEQVALPVSANLMDLFDKANEQIASDLSAAANADQIYEQTEPKSDESEPMLNAHYATAHVNALDEQNEALCDHVK
ncbi:hypothetical protein BpHYR1_030551 [Brachionus plicatilis]|uniref:Uncharacterized protein n=1 Tax=Brachionus plicatilis TaxID=10195 RepID=A0A3M7RKI4_BRAPC|nr:hypothetical protein BpHYR1_030551 [Brachionus plicatilis]